MLLICRALHALYYYVTPHWPVLSPGGEVGRWQGVGGGASSVSELLAEVAHAGETQ